MFHPVDHVRERQARAVEDDRVGGRDHRGDGAGGVAGIALVLSGADLVQRGGIAAALANRVSGGERAPSDRRSKELAQRIGKNHRALVAAFADEIPPFGEAGVASPPKRCRTTGLLAMAPDAAVSSGCESMS